ncbi:MAG: DegT/DnrJ/EryC1/StrS family aminotransferase, partial [Bacteroidota bacterium]
MHKPPIPFSPPRIDEESIAEVVDTLRSGWITTGPKTKLFEKKLEEYCEVRRV